MESEISNLKTHLKRTFKSHAWHQGASVLEALEGITPEEANKKIGSSHSIIQLIAHLTTWKTFTARRLSGDDGYDVSADQNFPDVKDWDTTFNGLIQSHEAMMTALENFPENRLRETVPGRNYDFYTLLHGMTQHDIYHTGQIVLLRKHA